MKIEKKFSKNVTYVRFDVATRRFEELSDFSFDREGKTLKTFYFFYY